MNVTHKQLKAFVAVARTQSFAEACRLVHLSQPALSIAIKNLEETVGGLLLARTTRAVSLTQEGEAFYPVAKRLLADWDNALEELHNRFSLQRGKVSIAAMPSFACNLLPSILKQFQQTNTLINISVNDVVAEDVISMVRGGRVEFGICFDPGDYENLHFQSLFDDQFVAVLPNDSELTKKELIEWNDLVKQDFILLQRPSSIRLLIDQLLQHNHIELRTVHEAHQLATIGRMVATGLGVSVVPSLCIQQFEEMGVQCKALDGPTISRKVGILTRKQVPLSDAASSLKAELVKAFQIETPTHLTDIHE